MIDFERESDNRITVARIKVLGVGGGGSNMVNSMIDSGYDTIDFIVANTDAQSLKLAKAPHKIQLGVKSTKGLGAGANPEVGRRAAEEDIDSIIRQVKDADVVFLTAGLGGGTGSGALPIIAKALREKDILSIAVVTKPFVFEGKRRMKVAQEALDQLREHVDTLIVIPNQKLIDVVDQKVSLVNAFSMINGILNQFIKSIADIIAKPGHINVDFADIKTIMKQRGYAVIGTGRATGEDRAILAARQAINSPLLDNASISGARGVLLNISGSSNLGLHELSEAASIVYEQAHDDASIILGSVIDESLGDDVLVTVIATGFAYGGPSALTVAQAGAYESIQPARTFGGFVPESVDAFNRYGNVDQASIQQQMLLQQQNVNQQQLHNGQQQQNAIQQQMNNAQQQYYQQNSGAHNSAQSSLNENNSSGSLLHQQNHHESSSHSQSPTMSDVSMNQNSNHQKNIDTEEPIDVNDLEIPALMRQLYQKKS